MQIGQVCFKIAGREANSICVIVEKINDTFVVIDGEAKRRKCNIKHLEPLNKIIKIPVSATHDNIVSILQKEGIDVKTRKQKEIKQNIKPKKQRRQKTKKKKPSKIKTKDSQKESSKT